MKNRYWRAYPMVELFREEFRDVLKVLDDHAYEPVEEGNYGSFQREVGEDKLFVRLHGKESTLKAPDSFTRSDSFWGDRYVHPVKKVSGRFVCGGVAFIEDDCTVMHVIANLVTADLLKELLNRFWSVWQTSLDGGLDAEVDAALLATTTVECDTCGKQHPRDECYHITGPNVDESWICVDCWDADECCICGRH